MLGNGLQGITLPVDLFTGDCVFGTDDQQLPVLISQTLLQMGRNHLVRQGTAFDRIQSDYKINAVDRFHLSGHGCYIPGRDIRVDQEHVRRAHVERSVQLLIGDDAGQIPGQGGIQIVVNTGMGVAPDCRPQQGQEKDQPDPVMPGDETAQSFEVRQQWSVTGLQQDLIHAEDHGRQDCYAGDYAKAYALGHDNAQIQAQCETHETQGDKSGNGSDRAAYDGTECLLDRGCHGVVFLFPRVQLGFITVPEENGIVHGDTQLQDRCNGFGHIGNTA